QNGRRCDYESTWHLIGRDGVAGCRAWTSWGPGGRRLRHAVVPRRGVRPGVETSMTVGVSHGTAIGPVVFSKKTNPRPAICPEGRRPGRTNPVHVPGGVDGSEQLTPTRSARNPILGEGGRGMGAVSHRFAPKSHRSFSTTRCDFESSAMGLFPPRR